MQKYKLNFVDSINKLRENLNLSKIPKMLNNCKYNRMYQYNFISVQYICKAGQEKKNIAKRKYRKMFKNIFTLFQLVNI